MRLDALLELGTVEVGYPPVRVPPWGGFAVAVADAREEGVDPAAVLPKA